MTNHLVLMPPIDPDEHANQNRGTNNGKNNSKNNGSGSFHE
jgi:hypothetical protein